jgi:AcrR family transcriptional regulator
MREEIKRVATQLLTVRGYRGVSYADIADVLKITTTNIHYHFGPKSGLVAEVLDEYVGLTGSRYRKIWTSDKASLRAKVKATTNQNREAFMRVNPTGTEGNSWSLTTRLASDWETLNETMRERILGYRRDVQFCAIIGMQQAIANGELKADAPAEDLGPLMASIFLHAVHITGNSGMRGLARHYQAQLDLIERAWGKRVRRRSAASRD